MWASAVARYTGRLAGAVLRARDRRPRRKRRAYAGPLAPAVARRREAERVELPALDLRGREREPHAPRARRLEARPRDLHVAREASAREVGHRGARIDVREAHADVVPHGRCGEVDVPGGGRPSARLEARPDGEGDRVPRPRHGREAPDVARERARAEQGAELACNERLQREAGVDPLAEGHRARRVHMAPLRREADAVAPDRVAVEHHHAVGADPPDRRAARRELEPARAGASWRRPRRAPIPPRRSVRPRAGAGARRRAAPARRGRR